MDLNLVRVFVAVYEARSLTIAAERLFVSQPAVSQSIGKLRNEFDDPLFTRHGRLVRPSALADSIYPELAAALAGVERVVDGIHGFDPATSTRQFRIALSELGEIGYFPLILEAVLDQAPSVRIEVVPLDVAQLPDWLARGVVDLAVTSSPVAGPFEQTVLKHQDYAVLLADDHPLAAGPLALADYLAAGHVVVAGDSGRPNLEAALGRIGSPVVPRVVVNRFAALPPLIRRSELIAVVPASLGDIWVGTWPVRMLALPFEVEPVEVRLYVRATSQHAAAIRWFHRTVQDAVQDVPERFYAIGAAADDA